MALVQDNHVVKQVASATSNPPLRNTVLPRTAKGRASWLASDIPHCRNHLGSKLCAKSFLSQVYDLLARHNVSEQRVDSGIVDIGNRHAFFQVVQNDESRTTAKA